MIQITLVYSPKPRLVHEWSLELPSGGTAGEALERLTGLWAPMVSGSADDAVKPIQILPSLTVAVWGRKVPPHHVLRSGDRVEVLRPLRVDPKLARRERFQQQGARNTGLFARRRPGAKAGY